ncbi:MAG: hypothetical protein ABIH26_03465, partial [Candidatus Eisenbacteria bacterium]
GSRANGNVFLLSKMYAVANQSRNEINARHNYWGPAITSTMDRLSYPAAIEEIFDYWDQEERAAGMVDYRNWLRSADEVGGSSLGGWRTIGTAAVLLVILLVILRRRPRARAG